jgi:hypothetical protein
MRRALLVLLVCVGCSHTHPRHIQSASAAQVGEARFIVEVQGKSGASVGQVVQYVHEQARETCQANGFSDYVIESERGDTRYSSRVAYPFAVTTMSSRPEHVAAVVCFGDAPPTVAQVEEPAVVGHCFSSDGDPRCFASARECEKAWAIESRFSTATGCAAE